MRRLLMVCAVTMLMFAAFSFAIAQQPSVALKPTVARNLEVWTVPFRLPDVRQADKDAIVVATGIAPRSLAVDPRGNVFLTNATASNRIFTLTGLADLSTNPSANRAATARLALVAGNGTAGSLGDGGNALAAQFDLKLDSLLARSGIAVGGDGTMFVADTLNATIRRIAGSDSSEPGIVRSIAGRWASNQSDGLPQPLGMVLDRSGNLYVADGAAGAIYVLPAATDSPAGDQKVQLLAHVASPASIAIAADGSEAFVASPSTGAIFEVDTQTHAIRSIAAFPPQQVSWNGEVVPVCVKSASGGSAKGPVCPAGLAVDGGGNLFVADVNAGNILRLDATTSQVTTAASGLQSPGDMVFDSSGNLYVAEQGANRVVKFASMGQDPSTLTITIPAALPPPPSPRVCPQTAPFNFCDEPVGGTTAVQAFTLTNNGSATVTGIAVSFVGANPGDFQAPSNTCGTSLAAGSSCSVNVDFAPAASGSRTASLSVTDGAGDSATASVAGTGDDYQLTLNGSPMEQSVIQGGVLKFNFTITPDPVFGGTVTIVCPSNLPSLSSCAPSSPTVTVTPGTAAQFSITFETTFNGVLGAFPTSGSLPALPVFTTTGGTGNKPGFPGPIIGVTLVCLALLFAWWGKSPTAKKCFRVNLWGLSLVLLAGCFAVLGGCKGHSVPANTNTPAGSTNLIIQGTAQNAGRGITIVLDVVARG